MERVLRINVVTGEVTEAMMPRLHGSECPRCRGAERIDHDRACAYRREGGLCTCIPAAEQTRLFRDETIPPPAEWEEETE